jgi:hypothetical protein
MNAAAIHALMLYRHAATPVDALWRLANDIVCGCLALRVGFPPAIGGRRLSPFYAFGRFAVASMAAAVSASVFLGVYALPFDVRLNLTYLGGATLSLATRRSSSENEKNRHRPRCSRYCWLCTGFAGHAIYVDRCVLRAARARRERNCSADAKTVATRVR